MSTTFTVGKKVSYKGEIGKVIMVNATVKGAFYAVEFGDKSVKKLRGAVLTAV